MLFTALAMKVLSDGTIAVCLKMKQNEQEGRRSTEETEFKDKTEEKEDESENVVLFRYDIKGNVLFKKTLNYEPCLMTEVMLEKTTCLVFSCG